MTTDAALTKISLAIEALEPKFVKSGNLGLHLRVEDAAEFKRLAIEAKALLDYELARLNDFSSNFLWTINKSSSGFLDGPSLAAVKEARAIVEGGINQIRRKPTLAVASAAKEQPTYVSPSRLSEERARSSTNWDVSRLVRLIEELNNAYAHRCYMSVAMLVRSITDHVPPAFNCKTFAEIANHYPGAKSFRGSMQHLDGSLRNIANAHLHVQIRRSETLPNEAQVDFRADLDFLLAEFVRLLK